ncbi:CaiB/BaiF CoA transferase family protein [Paraglaciecola hydrolytica]|uniref:Acyl-CoA transferase n=1 Tax=Paraglaciecola hydrolytica TaxID=1799789 RepID=A0A136A5F0_9ALTE|nr:CaiB/BaiF CoA-transferase family protein [Paraglaciecola hydrolytica]KXI30449.1 acyl-CoA transferase [Paraglaciecola hydrolytica]
MSKPLAGIKIIDLTHMLSGPYGSMILSDMGADTIKVEPLKGEGTRSLLARDPNNSLDGFGAYFITLNRNKRSIAVDLKTEEGKQVFYKLVKEADVVISNFGPGVPERLGIDYTTLATHNPRIITCTITGFGSEGPGAKRPAFDQVAQAFGGGMSITGHNIEDPLRAGIPIGDLGGGMFSVMGILGAIIERFTSGKGQHVDISMLDCQISMLNYMATMHFLSGENPYPIGNSHFVHVPYNSYKTQDGHIILAVITDNFWQNLKTVVNIAEFEHDKYDTQPGRFADKALIDDKLNVLFATNTNQYWIGLLEQARIPCAPVNKFSDALNDTQVRHRNMVVDLLHPDGKKTQGPGNPIKMSRSNEESFSAAPHVGQHTEQVLSELLKLSKDEISELKTKGIVA